MAGERIRSAYVAVGGRSIAARRLGVDLDIAGGVVTGEDVADCLAEGARAAAPEGATPLHAFRIRFALDGEPAPEDPTGLAGAVLNAEMIGLSVKDSYAANIETLLGKCGLEVEELVAGPYAASEACLIDDEKDLGVILVDIGARATDYALFEGGVLVACGGVGVGGDLVTRDIAQIFGAPLASAERIKTLHGSALAGAGDEHRLIDFPQLGAPAEIMRHSRAELSAVILPRVEETFELVLQSLQRSGAGRRGIRRAVITGGGSLLVGCRETAEKIFGVKTRVGRPQPLSGAPDAATAPQFAVAVGALHHAARQYSAMKRSGRRRSAGVDLVRAKGAARGVIGGVAGWLRQNF